MDQGGTQKRNSEGIGRLLESINLLVQQNSKLLMLGNFMEGAYMDMETQGKGKIERIHTSLGNNPYFC